MINIIDTYSKIGEIFNEKGFQYEKWEAYINSIYKDSAHIFKDDLDVDIASGKYTFEKDFLPILNAVYKNPKLEILHQSFLKVTDNLNQQVVKKFGKELDTDIVLYLGLCNGAGSVTVINGRWTLLLGVEKILELNWQDLDSMYGLVYHELGHVYHGQYGNLEQDSVDTGKNFVWQLFTEGIAMYFEQVLVGDLNYFHQGDDEWAPWCDAHFKQILQDFDKDLPTMSRYNQRYFGDWADYYGHGDVGYYLGNRFIHELTKKYDFDALIKLDIDTVYELYKKFVQHLIGNE